jgi:hypothetical protein
MEQAVDPSHPAHAYAETKRRRSPQRTRLLEAKCDAIAIARAIAAKGPSCEEIQAALGDEFDTRVRGDIGRIKKRRPGDDLRFDRLLRFYDAVGIDVADTKVPRQSRIAA